MVEVFQKFLGSGGGNLTIYPGFYSRRQFSGIFWAMAAQKKLYAQNTPEDKKKAIAPDGTIAFLQYSIR